MTSTKEPTAARRHEFAGNCGSCTLWEAEEPCPVLSRLIPARTKEVRFVGRAKMKPDGIYTSSLAACSAGVWISFVRKIEKG